jgi:hypothetical protein
MFLFLSKKNIKEQHKKSQGVRVLLLLLLLLLLLFNKQMTSKLFFYLNKINDMLSVFI